MPAELEAKLKAEAKQKGYGEERTNAYVYGTLRKTGWKPSREKRSMHIKGMSEHPVEYCDPNDRSRDRTVNIDQNQFGSAWDAGKPGPQKLKEGSSNPGSNSEY